ncbi:MAG: N-acetylmuramoyl-L-alanine amidase [Alcaligenaceae bacterium]|nr:N-acetylmuramoyl-L-alanine amidase [Alcaligenaceae bacterium]
MSAWWTLPCLLLCAVMATAPTPSRAAQVAVDIGHTPEHPGARAASGQTEYHFNLALGEAVVAALQSLGDQGVRTDAQGAELSLPQRTARVSGADLFLSIHHDSIQPEYIAAGRAREFSGYSLFVSKRNPQFGQSLRCARAIAEQLQSYAGQQPSEYHAEPIPGENRPFLDRPLGIHQFDDLVVLHTARMPAVLIEAGVIINPDEETRLASPDTVRRLAHAIAQGAHSCMGE